MSHRVTAEEMYQVKQLEVSRKITELQRKLSMHAAGNKKDNWPVVGDLGRVEELLDEINSFLRVE